MFPRPVLVYDGDCAFCTSSVEFIARRLRTGAELVAWQHADLASLGVTREQAQHEVVWVDRNGRSSGGAQAVAALLRDCGGGWRPVGVLLALPPFSWVAHGVYRLVARNRHRLPGGTPACALPVDQRPGAR